MVFLGFSDNYDGDRYELILVVRPCKFQRVLAFLLNLDQIEIFNPFHGVWNMHL